MASAEATSGVIVLLTNAVIDGRGTSSPVQAVRSGSQARIVFGATASPAKIGTGE